jgi:hypothetical protein
MWPGFRFAEELRAADSAEPSMHLIPTIRDALKIREFTFDGDRFGWKADVDRPAAGPKILTETTPTHPCDDWCGTDLVANRSTQTPSSDQHGDSFDEYIAGHSYRATFASVRRANGDRID